MNTPSDNWRLLLTVLYAAWVIVFAYAFVAYANAPYEGAGFPDGLNKPAVFLGWQGIAGALAFAVFGVSRVWPRGASARTLGNIPLIIAALLAASVVGFIFWAENA
jgi:hypothetical protein